MVAPSWALQWHIKLLGTPPGILCSAVWDLSRCLEPLIERDDLLDASMLEVAEEESVTFQPLGRRPCYWVRNQSPWPTWGGFSAWGSHQFGGDGRCAEAVTTDTTQVCRATGNQIKAPSSWGCRCIGWYTLGSQLDLTSIGSMQMIIIHNNRREKLEYCYETWVISRTSLNLTLPYFPDWPATNWELKDLWITAPKLY